VVIDNYPEGLVEEFDCPYHPKNAAMGSRKVPFSRELFIERDDFMEEPPKKFFRLAPGREVRLRYGYFIRCVGVVKDQATGEVLEVHCTYDPGTRSGFAPDGRKVDATIHWVSAAHALPAEVRLYDRLFRVPDALSEEGEFTAYLNPRSLEVLTACRLEPSLATATPADRFQFERLGYFCLDSGDSSPAAPVFNRTATLRDAWAKLTEKGK
jgi:glutaminyl-tRNA synthetase